jgi:hypothetical protein
LGPFNLPVVIRAIMPHLDESVMAETKLEP